MKDLRNELIAKSKRKLVHHVHKVHCVHEVHLSTMTKTKTIKR